MGDALRLPTFQDREHIGCAVCIALFCQPDRAQRQVGVILPGDPDDDVPVLPADKPPESSLEVGRDLFQIPDSLARAYISLFFTFLFFTFLISGTFKGVIRTFNWVFLTGNAFKGQLSKNTAGTSFLLPVSSSQYSLKIRMSGRLFPTIRRNRRWIPGEVNTLNI